MYDKLNRRPVAAEVDASSFSPIQEGYYKRLISLYKKREVISAELVEVMYATWVALGREIGARTLENFATECGIKTKTIHNDLALYARALRDGWWVVEAGLEAHKKVNIRALEPSDRKRLLDTSVKDKWTNARLAKQAIKEAGDTARLHSGIAALPRITTNLQRKAIENLIDAATKLCKDSVESWSMVEDAGLSDDIERLGRALEEIRITGHTL